MRKTVKKRMQSIPPAPMWSALAQTQVKNNVLWVLGAIALLAAAFPIAKTLELNSGWTALLPKDKPSVRDLDATRERMVGLATLSIAVESHDVPAMQAFTRDLAQRLAKRRDVGIQRVDWNVKQYQEFIKEHRQIYAPLSDIEEVHDQLRDYLDYQKTQANPLFVDLLEEPPPSPKEILTELEKREAANNPKDKFPDGYYVHPDRDMTALFVRCDFPNGVANAMDRLLSAVNKEIAALKPKRYAPDMRIEFAGDVVGAREEHSAIAKELVIATTLAVVLVLLSIWIFFGRFRALCVLGAALTVPVVATFALSKPIVDSLNTSTAFLGSIVVGNGINPMIIWFARFFEERRKRHELTEAVAQTHATTWAATLTASLAATFAYGSLIITDFRGFRDFGYIGAIGMLLCWLAAYLVLPALAVFVEKIRPLTIYADRMSDNIYGRILWRIVKRAPRSIWYSSLALGAVSAALVTYALAHDPLEYDFRKLRSVREETSRAGKLNKRMGDIVGKGASNMGVSFLTSSVDEARWLSSVLREKAKTGARWGDVHAIDDLLPKDQAKKIAILGKIRSVLLEMRPHANKEDRELIDRYLPAAEIRPLTIDQLPEQVARLYTEKDGTRGRILYVEERKGYSTWNGLYLVQWSEELRSVRLPNGKRPPLVGRAPIFADMIEAIQHDGPIVTAVSFLMVVVLLIISFGRSRHMWRALFSLVLGVAWMGGMMAALKIKLNFLNFVALPITFGIGVDYAVNFVRRYVQERALNPDDMYTALKRSVTDAGGAVVLCSLTTVIGYITLFTSANQAINSFGLAMTISEITCLFAACISVPTWLLLRAKNEKSAQEPIAEAQTSTEPAQLH